MQVFTDYHEILDTKEIKTGIRTVRVSREHGFQLNGQTRKLKGVCLHHDLGPLGAAINKTALIRQINMLKQMGCDAIRTSHNMPSTWQMDICDSLGMMVMLAVNSGGLVVDTHWQPRVAHVGLGAVGLVDLVEKAVLVDGIQLSVALVDGHDHE